MAIKFSELSTAQELVERLEKPFWHVRETVSHYTSLHALLCILSDRRLKFSSFDSVNDRLELSFVNENTRKKLFFCFMGSAVDNFGMWAMYGGLSRPKKDDKEKPPEDLLKSTFVRITVPVKSVRSFIAKNNLKATAVAYTRLAGGETPEKPVIFLGSNRNKNIEFDKNLLSGYVKDEAWKYENEVRIWSESEYVEISDEFIESMRLFPSPVISLDECKKLLAQDSRYSGVKDIIDRILMKNKYEGSYFQK